MDFSAFFLLTAMTGGLLVGAYVLSRLFDSRSKWRVHGAVVYAVLLVATLLFGHAVYQMFALDEPLWGAALAGDRFKVQEMLDKGASPNATGEDGRSAIEAAQDGGHEEIVKMLRDAGGR